MSIIRRINRFFWMPGLSIFDVMAIGMISSMMTTFNWWWALLYPVAIMISVIMQMFLEKTQR